MAGWRGRIKTNSAIVEWEYEQGKTRPVDSGDTVEWPKKDTLHERMNYKGEVQGTPSARRASLMALVADRTEAVRVMYSNIVNHLPKEKKEWVEKAKKSLEYGTVAIGIIKHLDEILKIFSTRSARGVGNVPIKLQRGTDRLILSPMATGKSHKMQWIVSKDPDPKAIHRLRKSGNSSAKSVMLVKKKKLSKLKLSK